MRQAVRALLIDGRPSGGSFRGAADYLAVALAPQAGQGGQSDHAPVQADVAPESALLERNLSGYDCLFLCNVAQFTASEAQTIDTYLRGGGNVVFFLGDQVLADRYNRELGVTGQGRAGGLHVLPAQIGPLVDRPQFRLDPLGYRHPILQAFRGRGQTSLLTTPVFKHYKLVLPPGPEKGTGPICRDGPEAGTDAERWSSHKLDLSPFPAAAVTVLRLADGDPLIVEQPVHRGRVVLVATSAEPSWTALPLWPSFVPLVQEMVAYCAAAQLGRRNLMVGEPLEAVLALPAAGPATTVQSPDGRTHPAPARREGDYWIVTYADTAQSGIYVVRAGPPSERDQTFAVNVDTAESDLAAADADELRDQLWPGIPFTHQTSWQDAGSGAAGSPIRRGSRLHVELLYAVLGLLLLETWLGWKMGYHGK